MEILGDILLDLSGEGPVAALDVTAARITQGMSRITAVTIEAISEDKSLVLSDFIGKTLTLTPFGYSRDDSGGIQLTGTARAEGRRNGSLPISTIEGGPSFSGLCISAENLGWRAQTSLYRLELRSCLWLLGMRRDNRVFQDLSTPEIITRVLQEHGLSDKLRDRLGDRYARRDYCLQFGETDLDFLSRLMEEEGISYYLTTENGAEIISLSDGIASHDFGHEASLYDMDSDEVGHVGPNIVRGFAKTARFTTGKVTLGDHNFELGSPALAALRAIPTGSHSRSGMESYSYPGHYRQSGPGETRARVVIEAEAARAATRSGLTFCHSVQAGTQVRIQGSLGSATPDFLVTEAEHVFRTSLFEAFPEALSPKSAFEPFSDEDWHHYYTRFGVIPKDVQYRTPLQTPWPAIPGVLNGLVVGPPGEEIHTDKYGRVRVQFFWDRLGKKDDKAGVFIRVAQPWAGKNWGMQSIPRIGQEVVVSFENGDPDRPIIIGMLYNANSMPPFALPAGQSHTGLRSNSTKGGGGFNELRLEDDKGKENVFFQSERDYEQIVKNDGKISVGMEHQSPGDLTVDIHHNLTETLHTGDHSFTVSEGHQKISIKQNQLSHIEGNEELKVDGAEKRTITGNSETTIEQGHMRQTVQLGDFSLKSAAGKVEIEALQEIVLKVGGSSIKIDQMGITMTGPIVNIEGKAMMEIKSPFSTVKGDGILILKGAMTMIN